ncbi:protein-L-isoaspartate O-methyltransferase [Rhizobium phaseoli]|uniref:protein-L-isoaspartate O-methyltransferase family protein n=1 Tax=Rhizobium phaseoli TaxID=396 RepID=UPI000D67982F|nr:protein-L-isoaspartate O-methyltransferase [Rhizobium phaseoli]PWI49857.1 protein-L-isoaspartate O-methyltransferase [Rhizobium phaseoli]
MKRRNFLTGTTSTVFLSAMPTFAAASVPMPYDVNAMPPMDDRKSFIDWMVQHRGEDANLLGERYDRFLQLIAHKDIWDNRNKRAYLMTPREDFVTAANLARVYEWHYLDIGFGVTITGPHTVARMTNTIEPRMGEKVLEIGTGSGYQAAYLSYLTDKIWSVEIIKPLYERTGRVHSNLIAKGYREYAAINRKNDDGYYGWPDAAPFDKIIVTCGIDHVPPPLLQQLKPNGVMVIPIGPPGAQHVLKIVKRQAADGSIAVERSDIYHGAIVNFVPFTKFKDGTVAGTHNSG